MGKPKIKKSNGHIPNSRIISEMARANRGWKQIGMSAFSQSIDPRIPPSYKAELQGQRNDGLVVTVGIVLDKVKIDMIPTPQLALNVARESIMNALSRLQGFRDCSCGEETSCDEHRTN
jgi:hypothetical protein